MSDEDQPPPQRYESLVHELVGDEAAFRRLTFSAPHPAGAAPFFKVAVRPVLLREQRQLQFSYFDGRKDVVKNYDAAEAPRKIDELLAMPFSRIELQATTGDLHVRITRKGRVLVTRGKPSRTEAPDLSHNRAKQYPLPAEGNEAFLHAVGITNEKGQVRATMQNKFHQVNEFLRILEQVLSGDSFPAIVDTARDRGPDRQEGQAQARPGNCPPITRPLRIVDCGCGSAHLTFAAYYYFQHVLHRPARLVGVDFSAELIAKCLQLRDRLGWADVEFVVSKIADFAPAEPPDVVLSLHACDDATDQAIARGVAWDSRAILAAPCCQHELHHALNVETFRPVLRHGVLRERQADILTDAFRAAVLRILGYRTDVIEFISPEHTSKNLMIRAVRTAQSGHQPSVQEYKALKSLWSVTPVLETLLADRLRPFLQ